MSDLAYKKYGFTVNDNSEAMQLGINAQKANLTDVLAGVTGLMKTQEDRYKQENTLNVQNYFKDKLQAGGLNAALTQPINQEEIKAKFGDRIDLGAVNTTATAQTDLLKRTAIESAVTEADKHLTVEGGRDPLKATAAFKNTLLANGATTAFADEQLPNYIARKATEVQNIQTAKLQEQDGRDSNYMVGLQRGGAETEAIQRKAIIDSIDDPKLKAKEDLRLRELGAKFLNISDTAKAEIGVHTQVRAAEQKLAIDKASLRAVDLENRLAMSSNNVPDDEAYTTSKMYTGELGNNAVNAIGKSVTNWFESFAPDDDTTHLQNFANNLVTAGHSSEDVQAATYQAYREFNKNTNRTFKDITASEMSQIEQRSKNLLSGIQGRNALSAEIIKEKINIANVTAIETAKSAKLQTKLLNAAQNQNLGRNASIQAAANEYRLAGINAGNKSDIAPDKLAVKAGNENSGTGGKKLEFTTAEVEAEEKRIEALKGNGAAIPATVDSTGKFKKVLLAKDAPQKLVPDGVANFFNDPQGYMDKRAAADVAKLGKTNGQTIPITDSNGQPISGYTPTVAAEKAIINNLKSNPTDFAVRPGDDGADYLGNSLLARLTGNGAQATKLIKTQFEKNIAAKRLAYAADKKKKAAAKSKANKKAKKD